MDEGVRVSACSPPEGSDNQGGEQMATTTCPPGIARAGLDEAFGTYRAVMKASTDYWSAALLRAATPLDLGLDLLDWFTIAARRERPQWATSHEVIAEWPIARLLDFSEGESSEPVATLFLPPQAGHDSCIVDFAENQSQIRTAKRAGLARVFSMDWIGATAATKDASIEDYVAVLADAVERLGGLVNLVGDCQGGWLAVIYAALYPHTVNTLTIAGAPVDFHAGEPLIGDWMKVLSPERDVAFYRALVHSNGGVFPGELLLAGFIAMDLDTEVARQLQLLVHLGDADHVARYRAFETWFKHTQPIAGVFYLWIVEHLFQNNELIAGTLRVGERLVDLRQITCPLYLLAGATDHITPSAQVFALADYAGTGRADVQQQLAPGGHLGLFMGHESLEQHWAPLLSAIADR
jgi:poly(3-hydroxybutyrate) depolymerase